MIDGWSSEGATTNTVHDGAVPGLGGGYDVRRHQQVVGYPDLHMMMHQNTLPVHQLSGTGEACDSHGYFYEDLNT